MHAYPIKGARLCAQPQACIASQRLCYIPGGESRQQLLCPGLERGLHQQAQRQERGRRDRDYNNHCWVNVNWTHHASWQNIRTGEALACSDC
eukprot:1159864-Pelagomonas_calceolata.AAC.11